MWQGAEDVFRPGGRTAGFAFSNTPSAVFSTTSSVPAGQCRCSRIALRSITWPLPADPARALTIVVPGNGLEPLTRTPSSAALPTKLPGRILAQTPVIETGSDEWHSSARPSSYVRKIGGYPRTPPRPTHGRSRNIRNRWHQISRSKRIRTPSAASGLPVTSGMMQSKPPPPSMVALPFQCAGNAEVYIRRRLVHGSDTTGNKTVLRMPLRIGGNYAHRRDASFRCGKPDVGLPYGDSQKSRARTLTQRLAIRGSGDGR
jgi:hypothetical protein